MPSGFRTNVDGSLSSITSGTHYHYQDNRNKVAPKYQIDEVVYNEPIDYSTSTEQNEFVYKEDIEKFLEETGAIISERKSIIPLTNMFFEDYDKTDFTGMTDEELINYFNTTKYSTEMYAKKVNSLTEEQIELLIYNKALRGAKNIGTDALSFVKRNFEKENYSSFLCSYEKDLEDPKYYEFAQIKLNRVIMVYNIIKTQKYNLGFTDEEIARMEEFVNKYGDVIDTNYHIEFSNNYETSNDDYFIGENGESVYGADQGSLKELYCFEYNGKSHSMWSTINHLNELLEKDEDLPELEFKTNKEFIRLRSKLHDVYGFTTDEAKMIITSIDTVGVCTYASVANQIFLKFRNNPEDFEKVFGFSMYKEDGSLNDAELILDMYIFMNDKNNGGDFWRSGVINEAYIETKYEESGLKIMDENEMVFLSNEDGYDYKRIDRYLKSKNNNLNYSEELLFTNFDPEYENSSFLSKAIEIYNPFSDNDFNSDERKKMKEAIENEIDNNSILTINMYPRRKKHLKNLWVDIDMISQDPDSYSDEVLGGGHAMVLTGYNDDGVYVASWGKKYFISYEDIFEASTFWVEKNDISSN